MLDIQAAWSAGLCCGPSGSRWNWLVASEVGGSKPTGTNPSTVMTGTVLGLPDLLHTPSFRGMRDRQLFGTTARRHGRASRPGAVGPVAAGHGGHASRATD